jgi:hypothetical protein
MGAMVRRWLDEPADGFGMVEKAADKRSGRREWQKRFFVAGCVVVCDIFYMFLIYMLGNHYILAGWIKGNLFMRDLNPCKKEFLEKYPWKKRNMERSSLFLREHGNNSTEFLELGGQKKETQKGMHSLATGFYKYPEGDNDQKV